jgi:hypothetical protein
MNRLLLPMITGMLLASLLLAVDAPAMRVPGPAVPPDPVQTGRSVANTQLGGYIVAASAAYEQLSDCACCCGRLDLPTHRCAACLTTAAAVRQVVANVRRVQAKLARLDVPAPAAAAHADLLAAADVLRTSGTYMARTVVTDPGALVVSTRVLKATRHGMPPRWVVSPSVLADARMAAFRSKHPGGSYRTQRLRELEILGDLKGGLASAPGEQALAYLAEWRTQVGQVARRQGVALRDFS